MTSHAYLEGYSRDWAAALELVRNDPNDEQFSPEVTLPPACMEIRILRYKGEHPETIARLVAARDLVLQKVEEDPENAKLLSSLGVLDAFLDRPSSRSPMSAELERENPTSFAA
jgi:hypothetical protein